MMILLFSSIICLFQEITHIETNCTSGQKKSDNDNVDADIEMDTEMNVAMEVKLGKVSLNHDNCMSR